MVGLYANRKSHGRNSFHLLQSAIAKGRIALENGNKFNSNNFVISFQTNIVQDQQHIDKDNRLNPTSLMERIPELGLVIDLTDTDRYYNPREFISNGVEHKKIRIQGHVLPPKRAHQK